MPVHVFTLANMQTFEWDLHQIVSMTGAIMVLAAFLASSFGAMDRERLTYAVLNWLGTALLAWTVWSPFNAGLFLVEFVWSIASFWLVVQAVRAKRW